MCISKTPLKPCFVAYGKNGQAKLFPTGGAAGRRLLFPALGIKRGRGTPCHALFLSAVRLRTAHTASAPSPADCVSRPTALRSVCSAPGLVPCGRSSALPSAFQPLLQGRLLFLIPRLAQKGVHIVLVGLHPRLVKGVDPQQIAGDAAGELEEVDQRPQAPLVPAGHGRSGSRCSSR